MLSGLSGCIGPEETRFLSLYPRPDRVESASYEYHDPFPDESAGPDTFNRPRTFIEPREDTRKNLDLRFLHAMHPTAGQPQYAGPVPNYGPAVPGPGGVPIFTGAPVPARPAVANVYPYVSPVASTPATARAAIIPAY